MPLCPGETAVATPLQGTASHYAYSGTSSRIALRSTSRPKTYTYSYCGLDIYAPTVWLRFLDLSCPRSKKFLESMLLMFLATYQTFTLCGYTFYPACSI